MSTQVHAPVSASEWDDAAAALPPRPRRRGLTLPRAALAAVLLAALGFLGGVEVEKGRVPSASSASASSGAAGAGFRRAAGGFPGRGGFGGGFAGAGGGAASGAIVGTVSVARGHTLYVRRSDGTTVRVRTTAASRITRTATAGAGAIHPGDTVIVFGGAASGGTVTAGRITATSSGAAAARGGGFGGGGGLAALFVGGG